MRGTIKWYTVSRRQLNSGKYMSVLLVVKVISKCISMKSLFLGLFYVLCFFDMKAQESVFIDPSKILDVIYYDANTADWLVYNNTFPDVPYTYMRVDLPIAESLRISGHHLEFSMSRETVLWHLCRGHENESRTEVLLYVVFYNVCNGSNYKFSPLDPFIPIERYDSFRDLITTGDADIKYIRIVIYH